MKTKKLKPNEDKVVISSEYYQNDRPSYICSFCHQTLIKLTDAGKNNSTYWRRNCQVEFDPEVENVRKESKLSVPDRNIEPAITSIGNTPDMYTRYFIEHEDKKIRKWNQVIRKIGTGRYRKNKYTGKTTF